VSTQGEFRSEARGLVLQRLYDIRHTVDFANQQDFAGIPLDETTLGNILEQLVHQNLAQWNPARGLAHSYLAFMARITAFGVDVIEGVLKPPIAISIDSSINVHGSQNIQIGGQGNVQSLTMDIEKMNSFVDSSGASVVEKEEAKSLLRKLSENKLVQIAIGGLIRAKTGGAT
jgi:hypothetical protein